MLTRTLVVGAASTASGTAEETGIRGLEDVLDRMNDAARHRDQVSIGNVVEHLGQRSFAPLLLVAGLIMLAPIVGDIPGVPVLMGLVVILVSAQVVVGRDHIWLPRWLLRRSVGRGKLERTVQWLRQPAGFIDRWTRRRYTRLLHHGGIYAIAVACIVLAAATPAMELVPFSANLAGIAITAFAVALIASDGLIAAGAIGLVIAAGVVVAWQFV